jgi:hypothetical protein
MTARLAQQYAMNGEQARARKLIDRYRALFPEDTLVREAAMHLDSYVRGDPLTGAGRLPAQPVPK